MACNCVVLDDNVLAPRPNASGQFDAAAAPGDPVRPRRSLGSSLNCPTATASSGRPDTITTIG